MNDFPISGMARFQCLSKLEIDGNMLLEIQINLLKAIEISQIHWMVLPLNDNNLNTVIKIALGCK